MDLGCLIRIEACSTSSIITVKWWRLEFLSESIGSGMNREAREAILLDKEK